MILECIVNKEIMGKKCFIRQKLQILYHFAVITPLHPNFWMLKEFMLISFKQVRCMQIFKYYLWHVDSIIINYIITSQQNMQCSYMRLTVFENWLD